MNNLDFETCVKIDKVLKEIYTNMSYADRVMYFDDNISVIDILNAFGVYETYNRYIAYTKDDTNFKLGDIVANEDDSRIIITNIDKDKDGFNIKYYGFCNNGMTETFEAHTNKYFKVGHINLNKLFE